MPLTTPQNVKLRRKHIYHIASNHVYTSDTDPSSNVSVICLIVWWLLSAGFWCCWCGSIIRREHSDTLKARISKIHLLDSCHCICQEGKALYLRSLWECREITYPKVAHTIYSLVWITYLPKNHSYKYKAVVVFWVIGLTFVFNLNLGATVQPRKCVEMFLLV